MSKLRRTIALICTAGLMVVSMFALTGCGEGGEDDSLVPMGETTIIENPDADHELYTANQQLYILAGMLKTANSYRSEVKGQTQSEMPKYVQTIHDIHIKNGDESFAEAKSMSFFVNVGKQAFFSGDKVAMREATNVKKGTWSNNYSVATFEDYRNKVGSEPTALSNYILNDDTIKSANVVKIAENKYSLNCEIDAVKATPRYAVKMICYGGLRKAPKFESCKLNIVFNEKWEPEVLTASDVYTVEKGVLTLRCTSELTETFSDFNKPVTIPEVETFRQKIEEAPSDIEGQSAEVEGTELLSDSLLQLDLKNGVELNGSIKGTTAAKTIAIPLEGSLVFDFDAYGESGLNGAFKGVAEINLAGIPVKVGYFGDNYLYVDIATTKYKYLLPDPNQNDNGNENNNQNSGDGAEENNFASTLGELIELVEGERVGDLRVFTIKLKDHIKDTANMVIDAIVTQLPISTEVANSIDLNSLQFDIYINKTSAVKGAIAKTDFILDLGAFKLTAAALVAELPFEMPDKAELESYIEADIANFVNNVAFIQKFVDGVNSCDLATGIGFPLQLGVVSEGNPSANILMSFAMKAQVVNNGLRLHLHSDLGALIGMPTDIYFENGTISLVNSVNEKGVIYGRTLEQFELSDKLSELLSKISDSDKDITAIVNSVIEMIPDLMYNSHVEVKVLEDTNIERQELHLCDNFVKFVSEQYKNMMNGLVTKLPPDFAGLIGLFNFDIDDVIIRAEYQENALIGVSLRLFNEKTAMLGGGKDLSVVVGMSNGQVLSEDDVETTFALIEKARTAMTESATVNKLVDNLLARGMQTIGDSFEANFTTIDEEYNKLTTEGQHAVINYYEYNRMKTDYYKLRGEADKFVEDVKSIMELDKVGGKEQEIHTILLDTVNPAYKKFKAVQSEYVGKFVIEKYLEIRNKVEKAYSVDDAITEIDKLANGSYATSADYNKAISFAEKKYNNLLDENKALVLNYEKIAEAKKQSRLMYIDEFNTRIKTWADEVNSYTVETASNVLKTAKNKFNADKRNYNRFTAEEKALVTNYNDFISAGNHIEELIKAQAEK